MKWTSQQRDTSRHQILERKLHSTSYDAKFSNLDTELFTQVQLQCCKIYILHFWANTGRKIFGLACYKEGGWVTIGACASVSKQAGYTLGFNGFHTNLMRFQLSLSANSCQRAERAITSPSPYRRWSDVIKFPDLLILSFLLTGQHCRFTLC